MEDTVHNYVATFYAHFDAQITEEMYAALEAQEMKPPQLVTLASFVQEEAGNAQDSNVAQVFRNRLAPPRPTAAYKAMPPAISRTMQTTIICGTGWRLTMADGIRSPRRSWRRTIPTPWRGCPQAPSPTRPRCDPGFPVAAAGPGSKGLLFLCYGPGGYILLWPHHVRAQRKLR